MRIDETYSIDCSDRNNFTVKRTVPAHDGGKGGIIPERDESVAYCGSFSQALRRYTDERMHDANPASVADAVRELEAIHGTIQRLGDLSRTGGVV